MKNKLTLLTVLMAASTAAFAGANKDIKTQVMSPAAGTEVNSGKEFTVKVHITNAGPGTVMGDMGMPGMGMGDQIKVDIKLDGKVVASPIFELSSDLMMGQSTDLEKKVTATFTTDKAVAQLCTEVSIAGNTDANSDQNACGNVAMKVYPTSISTVANNATIALFPNPATNQLHITSSNAINGTLAIYDFTGKVVAQHQLNSNSNTISIFGIATGIYLYRIANEDGQLLQNGKLSIN